MRVVAGRLRGRRIGAPRGLGTRPTSDRVRESLFNLLGPLPAGGAVLDLFAGSGALGIEAWSRGAATVTFVERDRSALDLLPILEPHEKSPGTCKRTGKLQSIDLIIDHDRLLISNRPFKVGRRLATRLMSTLLYTTTLNLKNVLNY